jgi:hypothetical protein
MDLCTAQKVCDLPGYCERGGESVMNPFGASSPALLGSIKRCCET